MPNNMAHEKAQIPTNLRLLLLLEEVSRAGVPVTPADLTEALGLPKPTVHRLFNTAEEAGFLQRDIDGRSYGPGPRLRRLSVNTLSSQRLRTVRLSILNAVVEKMGETCNIAVPDRECMVYLDRIETKWPLRIQLPVGTKVPFHCTASGKMYLSSLNPRYLDRYLASRELEEHTDRTITDTAALKAELIKTRKRGYSTDDEEFMESMVAVAVPIIDDQGRLVSTLSAHAPLQRHDLDALVANVGTLKSAAQQLSELLLS
jgi:IclR family acetate operon transcriptional repressor